MKIFKSVILLFVLVVMVSIGSVSVAHAGTAQVTVRGPSSFTYTVQIIQGSTVRWQNTMVTLPLGQRLISVSGLPSGSGYIGKAWVNDINIQSNTWPSKTLGGGTTHLGCLAFDYTGSPTPWIGSCP
ncbi:MAG: hypothetical protein WCT33_01160 [Patescibacteria group bacterium]